MQAEDRERLFWGLGRAGGRSELHIVTGGSETGRGWGWRCEEEADGSTGRMPLSVSPR